MGGSVCQQGAVDTDDGGGFVLDAKILHHMRAAGGGGVLQVRGRVDPVAKRLLKGSGIALGLHNHWQEFEPVPDGRLPEDIILQSVPELFAELDVYWVAVGKQEPVDTVARLKKRTPLLHIKDGLIEPRQPMKPIGQGKLDMPKIIAAADAKILEYVIVELDSCDIPPLEAVEQSYNYLVGKGLAAGNRAV